MKRNIFYLLIFWLTASAFLLAQQTEVPMISVPQGEKDDVPNGWFKAGTQPQDYTVGIDGYASEQGKSSAFIKSSQFKPSGCGTLEQSIRAENYRGERIRLTGFVKPKFVSRWAGLFMQVENVLGMRTAYDNMQNRPIIGSSDWRKYEIVLDVSKNAKKISFGVLLNGKGEVWIDDLKLEVVGPNVPLTDMMQNNPEFLSPKNMDFEK